MSAAPRMEPLAKNHRPDGARQGEVKMTTKTTIIANEFLTYDDVQADLRTLRDMDNALGYTEEGYRFTMEHGPRMKALEGILGWVHSKDELRAAMKRAIRSGRLVRGTPPTKTEAERVCLEYQHEIACGVWVYTKDGEIVGAEMVDFPSHDGAGWRGWKLAA